MEKKFAESNAIFKKVLAVTPDVTVRRYLAANLWQMHHYPEARENLQILLKQAPKDNQSRLLLGMVSENMKDYTKAAGNTGQRSGANRAATGIDCSAGEIVLSPESHRRC